MNMHIKKSTIALGTKIHVTPSMLYLTCCTIIIIIIINILIRHAAAQITNCIPRSLIIIEEKNNNWRLPETLDANQAPSLWSLIVTKSHIAQRHM